METEARQGKEQRTITPEEQAELERRRWDLRLITCSEDGGNKNIKEATGE